MRVLHYSFVAPLRSLMGRCKKRDSKKKKKEAAAYVFLDLDFLVLLFSTFILYQEYYMKRFVTGP